MEVVYRCCCGIDVQKSLIVACLRTGGEQELREFGTMTCEIKALANWLTKAGCEMAAMESTGSYWKPLYNLFEMLNLDAIIVNAGHMKAVSGRKTDVKDAEWIADLLQHGLLRASFVPDRAQRELRELTRYRKSIIEERSRELNRLQKVLEGANVKLGSVMKDIQGKSAKRLLEQLAAGDAMDDCGEISKLLHSSLLPKLNEIMASLDGMITPLQRELLAQILDHISDLDRRIHKLDGMAETYMEQSQPGILELCRMPEIAQRSAEVILAEIGTDMRRFSSEAHLCS